MNHPHHFVLATGRRAAAAVLAIAAVAVASLATPAAFGQSTWTGATSGLWNDGGNWSAPLADNFSTGLVFAGSNNVSTTNNLTGGTASSLTFNNGGFTLGGNSLTLAGNIFNGAAGNQTISLPLTLSNTTVNVYGVASATTTISGNISGGVAAGSIAIATGTTAGYVSGASPNQAVLVLSGSNSFTGNVSLASGSTTLRINHPNALSSGTLIIGGGSPNIDNTSGAPITIANNIRATGASPTYVGAGNSTLITTGTIFVGNSSRTVTVSSGTFGIGAISWVSGTFVKAGGGTLLIAGPADTATANGPFAISSGTLVVGNNTSTGTNAFNVTGNSTLRASSPNLVLGNAGTNLVGGSLTVDGTNGLTLNGVTVGVQNRTLTNNLTANSLTLAGTTALQESGATTGRTLTVAGGGATIFAGPIVDGGSSGASSLIISSTGATTLAAASTYSGSTTLSGSGATITLGNNAAFGTGAVTASASVNFQASKDLTAVPNSFVISANQGFGGSNSINWTGHLTQSGGGRTLTNNVAAGKSLTFSGSTFLQESGTNVGRTLTVAGSGNTVFAGVIANGGVAGNGSLTVNNTGTTSLLAANTYSGTTTLSTSSTTANVTVVLGDNAAFGSSFVNVTGSTTVTLRASTDLTGVANTIQLERDLTFAGPGSITFSGLLYQKDSPRVISNNIDAGKTLTLSGTIATRSPSEGSGRAIRLSGNGNTLISGAIINGGTGSSNGSFIVSNTGTTTLTGINTYTGSTAIQAGVLAINSSDVLQSTSGVHVANASTFRYTGASGSFGRSITITSGTGTVENTGGGTLTLAGSLTKNGTVLRLTGGDFNVAGRISGTSPNSDLIVDAATVTLGTSNTYNGPTFVQNAATLTLGINNALPSTSAVSLAGSTLAVGGFTNTVGSLSTSGNSTISVSVNGGGSGRLTMGDLSLGNGTNTLALSMTNPTAGIYNVLTYTGSLSGSVTPTGLDSRYTLLTGSASNSSIALQRKADVGAVVASPAAAAIITGGSTAIAYTVANATPSGGASLSFTSAAGGNVAGSSSGTALANATSDSVAGLFFTGTSIGLNQTGSFTVSDLAAITTTGTGGVSVNVLDHSLPAFGGVSSSLTTLALDFGSVNLADGLQTQTFSLTNLASVFGQSLTAGLALTGIQRTSGDNVFSTNLATFANLVAGGVNNYTASFTPGAAGSYTDTFLLSFADDQSLAGATAQRDLTVTMNVVVVPEPGALALAAMGVAGLAWAARRRAAR